ncbi:uncharacterized protein LOC110253758 [Exaiptasia diaphana]|uniref:Uncharacterized protein n=1 Tax=Exaiptasia diaphana TaxID=2652724 RepID=A0A913Y9P6_EXADI|nr:uncharacterized protein LOC110253758 [Exaiptasia diaphana]
MDRKRRLCEHCNQFVNDRTYRLHRSLYYNPNTEIWQLSGELSSDEDSNSGGSDSPQLGLREHFEVCEHDRPSTPKPSAEFKGAVVNELEEEDIRLAGLDAVDRQDEDVIYMERSTNSDCNVEIWNLSEEEVELDFDGEQDPRLTVPFHDVREEKSQCIVKWIMIFLCVWSSYCCISDYALDVLINFIYAVFKSFGTVFPTWLA